MSLSTPGSSYQPKHGRRLRKSMRPRKRSPVRLAPALRERLAWSTGKRYASRSKYSLRGRAFALLPLIKHKCCYEGLKAIGAERIVMSPNLDRKQVEVTEPTGMMTDVTKPTLTILRLAKDQDTGTAVLIRPGGGY